MNSFVTKLYVFKSNVKFSHVNIFWNEVINGLKRYLKNLKKFHMYVRLQVYLDSGFLLSECQDTFSKDNSSSHLQVSVVLPYVMYL